MSYILSVWAPKRTTAVFSVKQRYKRVGSRMLELGRLCALRTDNSMAWRHGGRSARLLVAAGSSAPRCSSHVFWQVDIEDSLERWFNPASGREGSPSAHVARGPR